MQKSASKFSLRKGSTFLLVLSCCLLSAQPVSVAAPLARITVEAGNYTRVDTPVTAMLDGVPLGFPADEICLFEVKGSSRVDVPVQLEAGSPPKLWWILSGKTEAGAERTYELVRSDRTVRGGVKATRDDKVLQIVKDGTKVLSYNHAIVPPPPLEVMGEKYKDTRGLYYRSGFIHPLWSPKGSELTHIHPDDHYHHVGIWMPWTKTKFEGKETDFWNLGSGQGTVRFKRFLSTTSGPVYGGFQAEQEHVALKTDEGEKIVLKEIWDVRVYNVGGSDDGYWLCDFVSKQRCVADSGLLLEQYRYGGFGYRGAKEWSGENAAYLTSEGRTRKDGHATRARWCDTAGVCDGQWKGVTHFSHPDNFRHPESMRIWPGFEEEVFFNWSPVQLGDFELKPGKDHVFRYRMFVHEGKMDVENTERLWNDYAHPPKVEIETVESDDVIMLFGGTDFAHWTAGDGKKVGWKLVDGAMKIVPRSGSIMTKRDFKDFKMHIEFKIPQLPADVRGQGRGNSGVYIQRRYEVQILDSYGLEPKNNECGSLYTFKAPDRNVCDMPGRWQSYDIIFHAARYDGNRKTEKARISVWHNGTLIHNDVELENKTGAGQPEGPQPGPILLQDHGNEVSFRNIWIVPL
ncbi:MAG: PmoA family protein [Sedimentisphaerales bacterium]|nr:PmoA family protein [Sedimentisphaerales bacterium]